MLVLLLVLFSAFIEVQFWQAMANSEMMKRGSKLRENVFKVSMLINS
jgi:hypothetical protein